MAFRKEGDVERHEVVTPETNQKLNELRKTGKVDLDDLLEQEKAKVEIEKEVLTDQ